MCNKNIVLANIFIVVQLSIPGYFVMSSRWFSGNLWLNSMVLFGGFFAIWAIFVANPRRVNIRPLPHSSGKLATTGPYKFIRHPMYSSQLLVTLAWTINSNRDMNRYIWAGYLLILMAKLSFEEISLEEQFPEYKNYQKNTWRLIPFIW